MPNKRGRKSVAELTVISFTPGQRLPPPASLTEAQATTWQAVVATKPADWFGPEHTPILAQYCRAVSSADVVAKLIASETETTSFESLRRMNRLLDMQARQARLLIMLARTMRLTQHSTRRADAAVIKPPVRRPWEIRREGDGEEPA